MGYTPLRLHAAGNLRRPDGRPCRSAARVAAARVAAARLAAARSRRVIWRGDRAERDARATQKPPARLSASPVAAVTCDSEGLELCTPPARFEQSEEGTVSRKQVCEQITAAVRPSLSRGEVVRTCGPVLATESRGRVPLLFRTRSPHYLVVTNQRLILFRAPRHRRRISFDDVVFAKRYATIVLEKTRHFTPILQLRLRNIGDRRFVLEFAPRDRRVGRELENALGGKAVAREFRRLETRGTVAHELRPLADEIAQRLPAVAPWTARPPFDAALQSLAWIEAQIVVLRGWVDQHGLLDAHGQTRPAATLLQRLESQASTLRAELGLTPQALARLLGSLATVATAGSDNGGLSALKAEGQRIVATRQETLGRVGTPAAS